MKIAFIGYENLDDPLLWAGIPHALFSNFKNQPDVEIKIIVPKIETISYPISVMIKRLFYNKLFAYKFGVYRFDRESWFTRARSEEMNRKLVGFNPDVILCCTAYQVNHIITDKPIFIYTDATFKLLNIHYTDYKRYAKVSVKQAESAESLAYQKASGIIFASDWAKQSALVDYLVPSHKINVIPFGSNLKLPANFKIKLVKKITKDNFALVFVGFDYERKGLMKAIKIHEGLMLAGVDSKLTIIGPDKLGPIYEAKNINFIGKLDKKIPSDCAKLLKAYDNAHFLILPTQVEAFGIVFCEAASLAIPSITHAVGGTDEIIKNNVNGIKLSSDSEPSEFVNELLFYIENEHAYQTLRKVTYDKYCERLNWGSAIKQLLSLFKLTPEKKAIFQTENMFLF